MAFMFISSEHEQAFQEAINKVGRASESKSIQIPLYVLTSMPEVCQELDQVFNFSGFYFDPDAVENFSLSTGEKHLFGLAMNLYNGYIMSGMNFAPSYLLGYLDKAHKEVALSAMSNRYL